ncbi:MAG: type 4a pilus biogenesis protein PilO [Phycisphaerales bacterium]|nr:type 4a pilus biogenesis protein PilO [Phycisphaerales bacterium]
MKLSARMIVLMVLLLAVPLSSYWLVFRPRDARMDAAKGEIDHMKSMLDKLRLETARNDDLVRANAQIKESVDAIEARLPNNKEVDAIVRQVSDLAVQAGLDSPTVKSLKPVPAALFMEQPMELSLEGDFRGFYEFLIKLEQLPRITRICDMKIKRNEEGDGRIKADFTLSIYFQEAKGSKS